MNFNHTLLILSILLISCKGNQQESANGEPAEAHTSDLELTRLQIERNGMTMEAVPLKDFTEEIVATGVVDVPPRNRSLVSAVMGGFITDSPLLVGDEVRKGQAVATLNNPEYLSLQQEYLEQFEQLDYLREEFERQAKLLDENITSRKAYLRSESAYRQTLARTQGLRERLKMLGISHSKVELGSLTPSITLRTPISGSVTRIFAVKGEYVAPETPVLEIVNRRHIHLEINVFEKDVMKVAMGQSVRFTIPEAARDTFSARVIQIAKALSEDRTVRVHADIDPGTREDFLVGMFVNARIESKAKAAYALPLNALNEEDGRYFVYLLAKQTAQSLLFVRREVKIGKMEGGWVEWMNPSPGIDTLRILRNVQNVH